MTVTDRDIVEITIAIEMSRDAKIFADKAMNNEPMKTATEERGFLMAYKSKLAGRLGELGFHKWCTDHKINSQLGPVPTNDTDDYDLLADNIRCEVKTKNTGFKTNNRPNLDDSYHWQWYLFVPVDQRQAHIRKGIQRYVCVAMWEGRNKVLLIGWCDDDFFRKTAKIGMPGEPLPCGMPMRGPPSYFIQANQLEPMSSFRSNR